MFEKAECEDNEGDHRTSIFTSGFFSLLVSCVALCWCISILFLANSCFRCFSGFCVVE